MAIVYLILLLASETSLAGSAISIFCGYKRDRGLFNVYIDDILQDIQGDAYGDPQGGLAEYAIPTMVIGQNHTVMVSNVAFDARIGGTPYVGVSQICMFLCL